MTPLDKIAIALVITIMGLCVFAAVAEKPPVQKTEVKVPQVQEQAVPRQSFKNGGPGICMPCVGPHMTFGGELKMFSLGPGLEF